jgi:hypothetical protein
MDDAAVLNVAARADADVVRVAANNAIVPDGNVGPDLDITDDAAAGAINALSWMRGQMPLKGAMVMSGR